MNAQHLKVAAGVLALTLLGYFVFPGHTYLQSDTQIYAPILEHLWDEGALANDLVAIRPHVTFSIYDEMALQLRRLTGSGFETVLAGQQLVYRSMGILGVWLIATALGIPGLPAFLVAGVFSLGATIAGPSVLIFEYEPVPRGFAVPLLLMAVGLLGHGKMLWSGLAASLAFLYHPPTTAVFWAIYALTAIWPAKTGEGMRRVRGLLPLLGAVCILFIVSRLQPGVTEHQTFFGTIDAEQEQLQRMRASYNWISVWAPRWAPHYIFLFAALLAAFWRVKKPANAELRMFLVGMPVIGLLSMPLSYLLLEKFRWALIPQFQPARAVLFVTAFATILGAAACVKAGMAGRWWESAIWGALIFAIPSARGQRVFDVLTPDLLTGFGRKQAVTVVLLAVLAVLAAWGATRWNRATASAAVAAAVLAPFLMIPHFLGIRNYPELHTEELDDLADWAKEHTDRSAVFLFPDAGKGLDPGVFRARSVRALYVDWKSGGQVNLLKELGSQWWSRWQAAMEPPFQPGDLGRYSALGIDYVVVEAKNREPSRPPVFENQRFLVYRMVK